MENKIIVEEQSVKQLIAKMKSIIVKKSNDQRYLKDQRKTVHNRHERNIEPFNAVYIHQRNRNYIRSMFYLYDLIRGKNSLEMRASDYPNYRRIIDELNAEKYLTLSIEDGKVSISYTEPI